MTRQEAVNAICAAWFQRDAEFCVGSDEREESEAELYHAMRALDVSTDELANTE